MVAWKRAKVMAKNQAKRAQEGRWEAARVKAQVTTFAKKELGNQVSSGKPLYSPKKDDGLAGGDKNVGYRFFHPDGNLDVVVEGLNYWGQYKTINLSNLPKHPSATIITTDLDEFEDLAQE